MWSPIVKSLICDQSVGSFSSQELLLTGGIDRSLKKRSILDVLQPLEYRYSTVRIDRSFNKISICDKGYQNICTIDVNAGFRIQ